MARPIWEQLEAKPETESCSKSVPELESVLELELEPEKQRFYDSPPPRMDVSVCCLPASAGSGAQHPHPASLPSGGQPTIQQPYQYADQIVPDRGQPDGLPVLGCTGQDNWQQISSASNVVGAVTAAATATTTYIDYSWLQMQVRFSICFFFFFFFFGSRHDFHLFSFDYRSSYLNLAKFFFTRFLGEGENSSREVSQ